MLEHGRDALAITSVGDGHLIESRNAGARHSTAVRFPRREHNQGEHP
jgi:hypothetical protein